jgi:transcriptional regulator with XRE-family HTH domain
MDLRHIFILNLKKFRERERVSQMILAELCDTSTSYIGEIEIGKKFPSIEMIERIAGALKVDAYRLFMEETDEENISTDEFLHKMPNRIKIDLRNRLSALVNTNIEEALILTEMHPLQKSRLMKQTFSLEEQLEEGAFKIAQAFPLGNDPSVKLS